MIHIVILLSIRCRCFPHVVNLACKAVLSTITNLDYAAENANDYVPEPVETEPDTFIDAVFRDPIATVRSLVRGVCPSQPYYLNMLLTTADVDLCLIAAPPVLL